MVGNKEVANIFVGTPLVSPFDEMIRPEGVTIHFYVNPTTHKRKEKL